MKDRAYNFFRISGEFGLYGLLFFLSVSNALVESFALLLLFGFIGRKIIKPDFKCFKFWPNIFLLLFLFFGALSLFNSGPYLKISLNALFGKWMQYFGICIIVQDDIYNKKIIKRGMVIFLFGATLAVFSGLSQYFFGLEFLRGKAMAVMSNGTKVITASFDHYNAFGGYLVVVLSLVAALLIAGGYTGLKLGSLSILSLLLAFVIILTFSRGSWLAIVVAFIFTGIIYNKNLKRLIPLFLVALIMFFSPVFMERLFLTFKAGGDSDRFKYWLVALKMIKSHPFFGIGIGTFMSNYSKYLDCAVTYAHNCYLQIWAESGIFSLVSFLLFVGSFIYLGVKKFFVTRDFLLLGLLSGAVGFLAHSFFEVNFYSLRLAVLFWVWAGLILACISRKE